MKGTVLLIPSLVGLIAAVISIVDTSGGSSVCDINSYISCTRVALSSYSRFMGISLSIWAIAYFILTATLAMVYITSRLSSILKMLWGLSIAAIPIIAVLIYIEIAIIRSLCIYCTVMHISIASLAYISTAEIIKTRSLRKP
ncbi:MAG: vitamin K epoxide reductase family protein [Sulfolobales archaeon]